MTDPAKQQKLKINELLTQLRSGEENKISKALKSLQVHGEANVIHPILEIWTNGVNEKNEKEIIEFLSSLKDSYAAAPIMEAVNSNKYKAIRQPLLNTIWNTKVDFSEYLSDFVKIATKGDFMDALECLTIIENLEGPFLEEDLLESQVYLSEYAENRKSTEDTKAKLISELAIQLKDLEQNLEG